MRWSVFVIAAGASGCFVLDCPRGNSYCEGDVLTSCTSTCTGDSKTNRSCSPTIQTTDCTTAFTVRKTCRPIGSRANCVNVDTTGACAGPTTGDPGSARTVGCTASGAVLWCVNARDTAYEDTRPCDHPNHTCALIGGRPFCVDAPRAPCDPADAPRCRAGRYDERCAGLPDAGHFLATQDCGQGRFCVQSLPDAGSRYTFCADPLPDGGPPPP